MVVIGLHFTKHQRGTRKRDRQITTEAHRSGSRVNKCGYADTYSMSTRTPFQWVRAHVSAVSSVMTTKRLLCSMSQCGRHVCAISHLAAVAPRGCRTGKFRHQGSAQQLRRIEADQRRKLTLLGS